MYNSYKKRENMKFDKTVESAIKDVQTTIKDGTRVEKSIDGVITNKPITHPDHRGRLFEIWNGTNDFWKDPVVYCYMFSIKQNTTKGWGIHLEKKDRYTIIKGEVVTVLYDPRLDSPTYGMIQKVTLSEQGIRQLIIPTGVWHMNVNTSENESFLINHPTEIYHHEAPDRYLMPLDSKDIPFDTTSLFPTQNG
jgi:dTDP-4-dehydrorhamnose 3,5-epimerase